MAEQTFSVGSIVRARSREWIVQGGSTPRRLRLRPLSGSDQDETVVVPSLEPTPPVSASFAPPDPAKRGSAAQAALLRDALRLKLRNGAGPFRSFGNLAVSPRPYQLVPLLMALKMPVTRLLVADDVGVGKTVEAALVVRELFDRGEISRFAVLCPPHLVDQWTGELKRHFHFGAVALTGRTVARLERDLPAGTSVFDHYKAVVVSLDYIKSERHRDNFLSAAPEFVVVDEAHACSHGGTGTQYRYDLVRKLASDPARHLLLLTATPHSGDREAFYRLIALLDPAFHALMDERSNDKELRAELGRHFVQRHRIDIENDWNGKAIFPRRLTKEVDYPLSHDWSAYLELIYRHCRELAQRAAEQGVRAAFYGYTALALLRCASSSPAAAAKAFQNRLDRLASDDEAAADDADDDALPSLVGFEDAADLRALKRLATELAGAADPKLAALDRTLDELFAGAEPFHPVVFCSYVETARYVADHLQKRYSPRGFDVRAVTGEIASADRELLVDELAEKPKRILVATDCLSEGINLQHGFDAVVHYDMVWNPTRHEQREGRVDRYGQPRPEVRCAMLYSHDNPVDGIVLNVIVRKAREIHKELGVTVPIPADDARINAAILNAVVLREKGSDGRQMDFLDALYAGSAELKALDDVWTDARESEKRNRTIFAQKGLKPGDVAAELEKTTAVLGSEADVARFVSHALAALGAPLGETQPGVCSFSPALLDQPLRERLEEAGVDVSKPRRIAFSQTAADGRPGVEFVPRTHPLVSTLADCTLESALADEPSGKVLAARASAFRTKDVASKTVLALLRLRHQLVRTKDGVSRTMIGEETVSLVSVGAAGFAPAGADFAAPEPSGDLSPAAGERQVAEALASVQAAAADLAAVAKARAEALLADHRRVRDASGDRGAYAVSPVLPPDVMGVYVFLPQV